MAILCLISYLGNYQIWMQERSRGKYHLMGKSEELTQWDTKSFFFFLSFFPFHTFSSYLFPNSFHHHIIDRVHGIFTDLGAGAKVWAMPKHKQRATLQGFLPQSPALPTIPIYLKLS